MMREGWEICHRVSFSFTEICLLFSHSTTIALAIVLRNVLQRCVSPQTSKTPEIMKVGVLPVALALMASAAEAIQRKPPPNNITPHLVDGWAWKDPFPETKESSFEPSCEAVKHFFALEYTLHDLMEEPPNGLKPWADGLKKLFSKREYPGGWSGYDRHGYDRAIMKMDYADVPLAVRQWIEEQERVDGAGKGLYGVFKKPSNSKDEIEDVVETPDEVDRKEDENKIVIFAPGAIYHVLPLWVAETSDCKGELSRSYVRRPC